MIFKVLRLTEAFVVNDWAKNCKDEIALKNCSSSGKWKYLLYAFLSFFFFFFFLVGYSNNKICF